MSEAIKGNWTSNAIETAPDLTSLKSQGFPTNGDPARGIPPTLPGASWFYLVDYARNSLIKTNEDIDPTKPEQFLNALKALKWLDDGSIPNDKLKQKLQDATESVKGIVEIATLEEVKNGVDAVRVITPKLFKEALQALGYRKNPPGTLLHVITKSNVAPEGFLFLDGSQILKAEYPTIDALGVFPNVNNDSSKIQLPNWDGRVGETTNNPQKVGTTIEDSLPTISGKFDASTQYARNDTDTKLFVKSFKETSICQLGPQADDGWIYTVFSFDASRVNAKFNGNKIQPAVYLHRTLIAY